MQPYLSLGFRIAARGPFPTRCPAEKVWETKGLIYIGEVKMYGGNYAPQQFAICDGRIIQSHQDQALFSLLGDTYGGNGRTTFGLPDLRSRLPSFDIPTSHSVDSVIAQIS